MTTILDNPFCNVKLVQAALDFYGLPHDYNRFFAKAANGHSLQATTPDAAGNAGIALVQNISLDFELCFLSPAWSEVG